jgi:hypothetical protein
LSTEAAATNFFYFSREIFGMAMRLGVGDAFVEEPSVQLVTSFASQARREEALALERYARLRLVSVQIGSKGRSAAASPFVFEADD